MRSGETQRGAAVGMEIVDVASSICKGCADGRLS